MQFMITAYDGKDKEAKARRLAVRQAHLDGAKVLFESGRFISGGAILDERGGMIGSTLHAEFESRAQLDEWLLADPYTTGGVWVEVDVQPIRLVK